MDRKPLLTVKNLKKYFNTPRGILHAVDDVSFDVYPGETLGLVGESGCGKSTVGNVLMRFLPKTDGDVLFREQDIFSKNKELKKEMSRKMQIIFQDPYSSLNPKYTIKSILSEPFNINKMAKGKELDDILKQICNDTGIEEELLNHYPHELDGGRRQRIGIARVLALNPEFIVCDEPVSALDVSIQAQILNLMQDLQDSFGFSYLFITHDLSVVKHLSDEIMVMYLGKMVEKCSTADLFRNPIHPYTQALLSAIPVPDPDFHAERIILEGEISSPIDPPEGCRFAARGLSYRCGYAASMGFCRCLDGMRVREKRLYAARALFC